MASRHTNVNAATHAVLEHGGPEHAGNAVALHVSYSQSDCREFVTIVQREVLRVGSVGGSQKEPAAVHGYLFLGRGR